MEGLNALDRQSASLRLFHEQDWGGMLEAEAKPARLAWIDDRFELFGRERILEYVGMLEAGPAWDDAVAREGFELVWLRPKRPLARRLRRQQDWEIVHEDRVSILFRRKLADPSGRAYGIGDGR